MSNANRILVMGATGTVGGEVARQLAARGEAVLAATRHPERFAGGASRAAAGPGGIEPVGFDLEQPATFAAALQGVDRVFLIARPGDEHSDRVALPWIDAMARHGVRHVVNLTAMGTDRGDHVTALRRIELHLESSGMEFTHLRPNFFMQLFSSEPLLSAVRSGVLRVAAGDARISFIDARDIAEVAAVALQTRRHAGRAYTLTGDTALDHSEIVRGVSAASGLEVVYQPLTEDEARLELARAGFPGKWVERLIRFYRLVRSSAAAETSPHVCAVLGRPPRSFEAFCAEHAHLWEETPARTAPSRPLATLEPVPATGRLLVGWDGPDCGDGKRA